MASTRKHQRLNFTSDGLDMLIETLLKRVDKGGLQKIRGGGIPRNKPLKKIQII